MSMINGDGMMLPKWKQRKYRMVLLFEFVVIRYEQREVQSMVFGNNIKKLREEKI